MHFSSLCRSVCIFVIVYASMIVLIPIVVVPAVSTAGRPMPNTIPRERLVHRLAFVDSAGASPAGAFPCRCSICIFVIVYDSMIVLIPIVVVVYFHLAVRIASFMC